MNYKPILIVLGTFIMGMVVGLLLTGVVIRKQLEPVRNLQTAKGIKNMVSNITADDTTNQTAIFEVLNENIAEMQALDLGYRAEMQINMDSLAKDLQPFLNEKQNSALQQRIESNRKTIDKRFEKSKHLKELEQRIEDLELQITEQIEEDNEELLKKKPTSKPNSNNTSIGKSNSEIYSNPPKPNVSTSKNRPQTIQTSNNKRLVINRPFIKDILAGYYGGNPRFINAFFTIKFEGDTARFQNFVKENFTGDTEQLHRVLNKQFRNKNRRSHRFKKNRRFRSKREEQTTLPSKETTPNPSSQTPAVKPDSKEQTLKNESSNMDSNTKISPPTNKAPSTNPQNLHSNESHTDYLPEEIPVTDQELLSPVDRILLNRVLQKRFEGDSTAMQQFIFNKFEGDSLLFLQAAKQRLKEQRKRRQKRRNW
ncbi:MAG: hypothetical protein ACPGVB_03475 [Chitinophagales bacterium]